MHRHCAAFARGGGAAARAYPRAAAPRHRAERSVAMAVLSDGSGGVLAERRPPGLLGGLWGLPMTEVEGTGGHDEQAALRRLEERLGAVPGSLERMAGFAWAFTHRTWRVGVYRGSCPAAATSPHGAWLDPVDRQAAAFGGPFRRALALAASWPDGPASRRSASPGPSA